jgi:hypothetical protein
MGFIGVIEPILFTSPFAIFGQNKLTEWDYIIAKGLFLLGCLLLAVQIILLLAGRRHRGMSYGLTFLACGILGILGLILVGLYFVPYAGDRGVLPAHRRR